MLPITLTKTILRTTDKYIQALNKVWIKTVWDLLCHFPRDYDDRTQVLDNFSLINIKEKNTILVKLISINNQKTANNKLLTKAVLEDKNDFLSEAVWFNRKYLSTQLQNYVWENILVSWKVKYAFWKITFQSPEIETDLNKISGEIIPIYPELNYIPSKWIASKIELLKSYFSEIPEILPDSIIKKYNFIERKYAFYKLHFPKNKNDIEVAKYRLWYEELFEINYKTLAKKFEWFKNTEGKSPSIKLNVDLIKEILSKLDFELTDKQKIVLFQILKDMEKSHAMARLLEWDVWTGKTVVALIAAIHVIVSYHSISPKGREVARDLWDKKDIIYSQKEYSPRYLVKLSKQLRKFWTDSERALWEVLRNRKFKNLKFRRQHPFWRYIADFYCKEINLVIELDWEIHKKTIEYDKIRDEIIEKNNIKILRFENKDVFQNLDKILNEIIPFIPLPLREVRWGLNLEEIRWGLNWLQVVFMAPTEILARQHFEWSQNVLMQFWIKSALLVWSTTKKQKEITKTDLKNWNIDMIFWTHALVQEDVLFQNLWFVIIDEQHRFWVKQREILESGLWNISGLIPHSLNMTATPIPRTLALTLYWDQDLSIINQYPKWRKEIFTKVVKNEIQRKQVENFIKAELEKGRQVFWISPLVEESEKIDLANAINTFELLKEIFFEYNVWLLHWKMKAKEKEKIMQDFKENKIQILSSTSVVEVWVNVPNATIMCIEWAERFGLSQLHQFRWRVWRWKFQSYCYLFPTNQKSTDRLNAMERTNNWFELSEIDLEIRWPGEVYWLKQSWIPDLKIADLKDLELVTQIREDIEELFNKKEK